MKDYAKAFKEQSDKKKNDVENWRKKIGIPFIKVKVDDTFSIGYWKIYGNPDQVMTAYIINDKPAHGTKQFFDHDHICNLYKTLKGEWSNESE